MIGARPRLGRLLDDGVGRFEDFRDEETYEGGGDRAEAAFEHDESSKVSHQGPVPGHSWCLPKLTEGISVEERRGDHDEKGS